MNRTASIVIADGYTDAEFLVAYYWLLGDDFLVQVYSLNGGPVKGIQGWTHKKSVQMTPSQGADVIASDLLVLIGGVKAMEYLRQHRPLIWWIEERAKQRRAIASICHGAQLLIEADVIKGATISGYYSIQKDIENAGATYSREPVVCFEPFITSPHYDFTGKWIKRAVYECQRSSVSKTGDFTTNKASGSLNT